MSNSLIVKSTYSCFGQYATCDVKNVFGFWVFQRRQSNSEKVALSRLHVLPDLLGK